MRLITTPLDVEVIDTPLRLTSVHCLDNVDILSIFLRNDRDEVYNSANVEIERLLERRHINSQKIKNGRKKERKKHGEIAERWDIEEGEKAKERRRERGESEEERRK